MEKGEFGSPDMSVVRHHFERAAQNGNTSAWRELARLLEKGLGGSRDFSAAYYWVTLDSRFRDPAQYYGRVVWGHRRRLAEEAPASFPFEKIWQESDSFVARYRRGELKLHPAPYDYWRPGAPPMGAKRNEHHESLHRKRWANGGKLRSVVEEPDEVPDHIQDRPDASPAASVGRASESDDSFFDSRWFAAGIAVASAGILLLAVVLLRRRRRH